MNPKNYLLALNRMHRVGPRTVEKLLKRWPDLSEMFALSSSQLMQAGLPSFIAKSIENFNFDEIEMDLKWASKDKHHILTWFDENYPKLLREIADPPPVLYAIGNLSCMDDPTVAMVGTREPSASGRETASRFAYELASKNICIVSGLARGIDAQVHQGCLDAGGKTIAVMGTGIDCIYPSRHRNLADKITENGLLLSELPLKSPPIAGHFPRRNRIISGLSLIILVIEAAIKSGSLITARLALEQNRDVMAIPGSIYNLQSKGCHYLLQQGAKLVTSSQDILDELDLSHDHHKFHDVNEKLALKNENLVKCIGFEVTTMDDIIARSGLSIEKVIVDLAELELEGIVNSVPGGYTRCTI